MMVLNLVEQQQLPEQNEARAAEKMKDAGKATGAAVLGVVGLTINAFSY
jgi:hypothetical protein